jgi:hypothetical protein
VTREIIPLMKIHTKPTHSWLIHRHLNYANPPTHRHHFSAPAQTWVRASYARVVQGGVVARRPPLLPTPLARAQMCPGNQQILSWRPSAGGGVWRPRPARHGPIRWAVQPAGAGTRAGGAVPPSRATGAGPLGPASGGARPGGALAGSSAAYSRTHGARPMLKEWVAAALTGPDAAVSAGPAGGQTIGPPSAAAAGLSHGNGEGPGNDLPPGGC